MKTQIFNQCVARLSLIAAIVLLILEIGQVNAGPYPPTTATVYAGMVKPQRGVVDYTGTPIAGQYSTVHLGNYNGGAEGSGSHPGVDITEGDCQVTPIRAIAQGTIVVVVRDWLDRNPGGLVCGNNQLLGFRGFGNRVVVRHDGVPNRDGYYGTAFSVYAHLASVNQNVDVNDKVLRGTIIGYQGSTGGSTGSHLHFQMDQDRGGEHPYWPTTDVNSTADAGNVRYYTYNAMRFVQAHIVRTAFAGSGACTEYFVGMPSPSFCEDYEREIDHEWFGGGPSGFPVNNFSARWEGSITLSPASGWVFYATVDDGVRLWIDNNLKIDRWSQQQSPVTHVAVVPLTPGTHQVKMEYFEASGGAVAQLAWQKAFSVYLPVILKQP